MLRTSFPLFLILKCLFNYTLPAQAAYLFSCAQAAYHLLSSFTSLNIRIICFAYTGNIPVKRFQLYIGALGIWHRQGDLVNEWNALSHWISVKFSEAILPFAVDFSKGDYTLD